MPWHGEVKLFQSLHMYHLSSSVGWGETTIKWQCKGVLCQCRCWLFDIFHKTRYHGYTKNKSETLHIRLEIGQRDECGWALFIVHLQDHCNAQSLTWSLHSSLPTLSKWREGSVPFLFLSESCRAIWRRLNGFTRLGLNDWSSYHSTMISINTT